MIKKEEGYNNPNQTKNSSSKTLPPNPNNINIYSTPSPIKYQIKPPVDIISSKMISTSQHNNSSTPLYQSLVPPMGENVKKIYHQNYNKNGQVDNLVLREDRRDQIVFSSNKEMKTMTERGGEKEQIKNINSSVFGERRRSMSQNPNLETKMGVLGKKEQNVVVSQKVNKMDLKMSNIETDMQAKKELKAQIEEKTKIVSQLRNNKDFFKSEFQERIKEFISKIKNDIKEKIYTKTQKKNLHYIYKHYESMKNNMAQNLAKNLNKIKTEKNMRKIETEELTKKNGEKKVMLKQIINDQNLIKSKNEIIQNLSKNELEYQIKNLHNSNNDLKEKINKLEMWKKKELYNLKMQYELKGRLLMQKEALRIAAEFHDNSNSHENMLAQNARLLIESFNYKEQVKDQHIYYQLMNERNQLKIELDKLNSF
jgi:hypothetical protein